MSSDALPPLSPRPIATSEFSHRRSFRGAARSTAQEELTPPTGASRAEEQVPRPEAPSQDPGELMRPPPLEVGTSEVQPTSVVTRSIAGALFPHLDAAAAAAAGPRGFHSPVRAAGSSSAPPPPALAPGPALTSHQVQPPAAPPRSGIPRGLVEKRDVAVQAHQLTDGSELPPAPKWGGPVQTCCAPGYRGDVGCYWCCYCTDVTCCARPDCTNCGVGFAGCLDTTADSAFGAPWDASQGRAVLSVGWGGASIATGSVWRSHLRSFLLVLSGALVILLSGAAYAAAWRVWRRVDGASAWSAEWNGSGSGNNSTLVGVQATASGNLLTTTAAAWLATTPMATTTFIPTDAATNAPASTNASGSASDVQWAPLRPREDALLHALLFFVVCGGVTFVGVVLPLLLGSTAHAFPVWAHTGIFNVACVVFLATAGVPLSVLQICLCMSVLSDADPYGFLVLGTVNNVGPEAGLVRATLVVTCVTTGGWMWFLYMVWASEWLHRQVGMRVRAMRDAWRAREATRRLAERRQRLVASVIAFAQDAPRHDDESWSMQTSGVGTGTTPLVNRQ